MASEETVESVKGILGDALGIGERAEAYDASTPLLGSMPEFDSMAVVAVLNSLEEQFELEVGDDEIDAETFASIGSLADFVEAKLDG